jgi:hypothetical protein
MPLVLLSLLLVNQARSTVEQDASEVVIWGGGETPEDAAGWMDEWKSLVDQVTIPLRLRDSYPRIAQSSEMPGLRPGFHIVILGVCRPGQLTRILPIVKALNAGAYARKLTTPAPESCPAAPGDARVSRTLTPKVRGTLPLTVTRLTWTDESLIHSELIGIIRDSKGRLVDSRVSSFEQTPSRDGPDETGGCDGSMEPHAASIRFQECEATEDLCHGLRVTHQWTSYADRILDEKIRQESFARLHCD